MKFNAPTPLRLIKVRKGTSQKGNPYAFVTLADESTFENADFMLHRDANPDFLELHTRYKVELNQDGNFFSVELTPEKSKYRLTTQY